MGKGKRFELNTKKEINANTKPYVKAHRPDFSGSSVGEAADVMVVWQANRYDDQMPCGHPERHVAYAELKKRQGTEGNRTTVMSGSSEKENGEMESGLEELQELRKELPPWSRRLVAVKFPHRELIVLDADALEHHLRADEEGWGPEHYQGDEAWLMGADTHGARLTPSNNISMVMPELEWWNSSTAGQDDWKKLALAMGLEEYDFR